MGSKRSCRRSNWKPVALERVDGLARPDGAVEVTVLAGAGLDRQRQVRELLGELGARLGRLGLADGLGLLVLARRGAGVRRSRRPRSPAGRRKFRA